MFLKYLSIYAIKYLIILILIYPWKIIKTKQIETDGKERNSQSCVAGLSVQDPRA